MELDFMGCIAHAIGRKKDDLVPCNCLMEDLRDILADLGDRGNFDSLKRYVVRREDGIGQDCVDCVTSLVDEEIFQLDEPAATQEKLFPSTVTTCPMHGPEDGMYDKKVVVEDLRAAVVLGRPTWYFHLWALFAFGIYTNEELGRMSIDMVNQEYAISCSDNTLPAAYKDL